MASKDSRSGRFTLPQLLAVVVISVILSLVLVYLFDLRRVPFQEDYVTEPPSSVSADKLLQCEQDVLVKKAAGQKFLTTDEIHQCTESSMTDHPSVKVIGTKVDELKWLLTVIVGLAALFTVLQAGASWFNASSYKDLADEKLKSMDQKAAEKLCSMDENLDEMKTAITSFKRNFPFLEEVQSKRAKAHEYLTQMLKEGSKAADKVLPTEAILWLDDFYGHLTPERRQALLSVESFVSIDLFAPGTEGQAEKLKEFAIFYHAKFLYEKSLESKAGNKVKVASFADLERAEGYLLMAIRASDEDFTLYNELGNLYLTMRDQVALAGTKHPAYLDKALKQFDESRKLESEQQRVYYNLAYVKSVHERNYDGARKLLEEALRYTNWQRNPAPNPLSAYVYYNLGCSRARVIARKPYPITENEAAPVVSALKKASAFGKIRRDYVENDYDTAGTGDIYDLFWKAHPSVRDELNRIRPLLIG